MIDSFSLIVPAMEVELKTSGDFEIFQKMTEKFTQKSYLALSVFPQCNENFEQKTWRKAQWWIFVKEIQLKL